MPTSVLILLRVGRMIRADKIELRDVPAELHDYLPKQLTWLKEDTGAWGSWPKHGPISELYEYGQQWVNYCKQKRNVIQAGGNCGMYARYYTSIFEKVYSFEPDPDNYYCLQENLKFLNAEYQNVALSDVECTLRLMNSNKKNAGTHHIDHRSRGGIEVQAITIDSLNLNDIDLIHLDLESHEDNAIRGAIETIKRCRPVIISERNITSLLATLKLDYNEEQKLQDYVYIPF